MNTGWAHVHVTTPDGERGVAAQAAILAAIGYLPADAGIDVQSVHSCSPRFTGADVRYHVLIRVTSSDFVDGWSLGAHAGCVACSRCNRAFPYAPDAAGTGSGSGSAGSG